MSQKTRIFGIDFDRLSLADAVDQVLAWAASEESICRYVVTPNVDHVVKFQEEPALRAAYADASMVVVDGKPVLWASKILGRPLPGLVPGSDLGPAIFDAADRDNPLRVFLFGAAEGVADRAAQTIKTRWPWIDVCGVYSPPLGFSADSPGNETAIEHINSCRPAVLIIGLGAPKQEIWISKVSDHLNVKVTLCLGATIDFLAGEQIRAPVWMRRIGLEWLHRMLTNPRRLAVRYIKDGLVFPRLFIREMREKQRESGLS